MKSLPAIFRWVCSSCCTTIESRGRHRGPACTPQSALALGHLGRQKSGEYIIGRKAFVQFSAIHFNSIQVNSIQFNSVQFSSVQFSSIQFSSVQFNSVQFSSVQFSSVQFSSIQFSSIKLNSIQYGSIQFNSIQLSSVYIQFNTTGHKPLQMAKIASPSLQEW